MKASFAHVSSPRREVEDKPMGTTYKFVHVQSSLRASAEGVLRSQSFNRVHFIQSSRE